MNREIEFRMWSGSKMFYDQGLVLECFKQQVTGFYDHEKNDGSVFMQFTGLLDKNGVKIFEGDVIRDDNKIIREVIFETYLDTGSGFTTKPPTYVWWDKQCEVIGNIFENPELLEEK